MLKIWGRTNSVNVQKVLWCCDELSLPYERIDAGMQYGRNHEPEYLAMNPNGKIPVIEDGDYMLWESNAIVRYLAMQYGSPANNLYPDDPKVRAGVDRWLDWSLSTLQPADRPVFVGMIRTPKEKRDMAAIQAAAGEAAKLWQIVEAHLKGRHYLEGGAFSLADMVIGAFCRRYIELDGIERPSLPLVQEWYARLKARPAFQRHIAPTLS
ncbi:MAG: glutathione S-transferase [Burkholderiaceae bacterium]|nr:MAG: glutathione S-transferase [Burkholderiaceae bacterium]